MDLTQIEYMERLVNLLPDSAFVGKNKMVFGTDSLLHAAQMTEAIANEMMKHLVQFQDTDLILDLKDATRNLAVLGRFMTITFETLTNGPE